VEGLRAWGWGLRALSIDRDLLGLGKIAVQAVSAVLPDGTAIDLPALGEPPGPRTPPPAMRDALVKIAAPIQPADGAEMADEASAERRYVPYEQSARNSTAPDRPAHPLKVGRLNVRLIFEGESEDDLASLPIARVREVAASGAVALDPDYVPPCLDLHVSDKLRQIVNETRALLKSRAESIAARAGASRPAADGAALIDLFTLALINGYEAELNHFAAAGGTHPVELHQAMLRMTAELSTFSSERRPPADLPPYRHDAIQTSLEPLVVKLREYLAVVIERNAVPLELQPRGYGIVTATIADRSLLQSSRFVLVAVAAVPAETLRSQLPNQMKIGAVEQIRDLVNLQLPGIPMRALPVAPPELPFLQNAVYFELDQSVELWRALARSAAFAMHLSGDYPELHMEFWAIRKKGT
jgi:type VI secretion system protein ImpJ